MEESMRSLSEMTNEINARIARLNAVLGLQAEEERREQTEEVAIRNPPSLINFEDERDMIDWDADVTPRRPLIPLPVEPQTPLRGGYIIPGLPTGPRLPDPDPQKNLEHFLRVYRELKARGRIPPGFELPDVPLQAPEWAQCVPDYQEAEMPAWPQDFYQTGGPLAQPWPDEPEFVSPDVLEGFDPFYITPEVRTAAPYSYYEELAPSWEPTPSAVRRPRSGAPRDLVEEFDPLITGSPARTPPKSPSRTTSPRSPSTSPTRTPRAVSPKRSPAGKKRVWNDPDPSIPIPPPSPDFMEKLAEQMQGVIEHAKYQLDMLALKHERRKQKSKRYRQSLDTATVFEGYEWQPPDE